MTCKEQHTLSPSNGSNLMFSCDALTKASEPSQYNLSSLQSMNIWLILLAAGSGTRLSVKTKGLPKQFLLYQNIPLYMHSAVTQSKYANLKGIVFVFSQAHLNQEKSYLEQWTRKSSLGIDYKIIAGGERRQDSVRQGLKALPPQCTHVLIHDSARPFASVSLTHRLCLALANGTNEENVPLGVIPALPVTDTIKEVKSNYVLNTPNRNNLYTVQTPQAFEHQTLLKAHTLANQEGWDVTDDASLLEKLGEKVLIIQGEEQNTKITYAADLMKLQNTSKPRPCSGFGYDVHAFVKNNIKNQNIKERPLKLGGVLMDGGQKVIAHSDGDVLLHALMDALLGAASLGDIGLHFPDTSDKFDNVDSAVLLQEVLGMLREKNVLIQHVDITIITQKPKIAPQRQAIAKNIAHLLTLPLAYINVKATTEEGLGFTGSGDGIKVMVVVNALQS